MLACLVTTPLLGCLNNDDRLADIAIISTPEEMFANGPMLSPAAQQIQGASKSGLVVMNASGEIVPGLAERWVITDDGLGYIFRLRNRAAGDEQPISGQAARNALIRAIRKHDGTPLGLDLAVIADVKAMTGRVIDIRLKTPTPQFLRLLAQPEMGLELPGGDTGAMTVLRSENSALMTPVPPEQRGMPQPKNWRDTARDVRVIALDAQAAVDAFDSGTVYTLMGGTINTFPMADLGALSRGTVRLDAVSGLLGIKVKRPSGFLAEPFNREVLAMAIDRPAFAEKFNIGGWQMTTRLVAPGQPDDTGTVPERWVGMDMDQRIASAKTRVDSWRDKNGGKDIDLTLLMPEGPGSDIIFAQLKRDYSNVGIILKRASDASDADLIWFDRVARYDSVRWYINQFNCGLGGALCSPVADRAMANALTTEYPAQREDDIANAEAELTKLNVYIPIGAPVRWSLVRSSVTGFTENRWAQHPLLPFAIDPT